MYLNLLTPKILLLPLRTDNHTVLMMLVKSIILVLDPLIIPLLIFFFILISCLLGIVLITMLLICMCYQVVTEGLQGLYLFSVVGK